MLQRSVKTVEYLQQRQDNLAFAAAHRARPVTLDPPPVVLEISHGAQIEIVLATQLFFDLRYFRRLISATAVRILFCCFHILFPAYVCGRHLTTKSTKLTKHQCIFYFRALDVLLFCSEHTLMNHFMVKLVVMLPCVTFP